MTTFLVIFVIAIAISDLHRHRIPNVLTVSAAAAAFALSVYLRGASGAVTSGTGLLVGLAVFLPFYLARGFSAGDVKAMAAVGAFVGPKAVLMSAGCTLVAGAIGGVLLLIRAGGYAAVESMAHRWFAQAWVLCRTGHTACIAAPVNDPALTRFPYGLAIACGTLVGLVWSH